MSLWAKLRLPILPVESKDDLSDPFEYCIGVINLSKDYKLITHLTHMTFSHRESVKTLGALGTKQIFISDPAINPQPLQPEICVCVQSTFF